MPERERPNRSLVKKEGDFKIIHFPKKPILDPIFKM